jgi:hypothetical protein
MIERQTWRSTTIIGPLRPCSPGCRPPKNNPDCTGKPRISARFAPKNNPVILPAQAPALWALFIVKPRNQGFVPRCFRFRCARKPFSGPGGSEGRVWPNMLAALPRNREQVGAGLHSREDRMAIRRALCHVSLRAQETRPHGHGAQPGTHWLSRWLSAHETSGCELRAP